MSENDVKNTTAVKKASTAGKDRELEELKAQNAMLMELLAKLTANSGATHAPAGSKQDVRIVYMSDSDGVINTNELELICTKFGETFTVSRGQFDAIVGKYRGWFDKGILAVAPEDVDMAAAKGIKTTDEYSLSAKKLEKLGTMSTGEIEALWNAIETDAQKLALVQYFKRKYIEGKEIGYQDRAKIELLNRLTNNGLKREAVEVSGGELKITPIDMNYSAR